VETLESLKLKARRVRVSKFVRRNSCDL